MKTTLDELQTFMMVVDTGSITAASDELQQSISATSRILKRLEGKLQTTLLKRTTRRLELTQEGQLFLAHAKKIIAAVDCAENELLLRKIKPSGRLRVDAATPVMLHAIIPLLAGFRAKYPDIQLELTSNEGMIDLIEKRTDIAFRSGSLKDSSLHARFITKSPLQLLASPEYLQKHGCPMTVSQLQEHSLLGFSQAGTLNHWPLRQGDVDFLLIQPSITSSSGETLRQLAVSHQGIVCLSDFVSAQDRKSGRLLPVLSQETLSTYRSIHVVYYRNTALAARIACFVDYVIAHFAKVVDA